MEITVLLTAIVKMGLMIGIGLFISKFIPLTADIKRFNVFLLVNVALPSLIVNGILHLAIDNELMMQILYLLGLSLLLHFLGITFFWLIGKLIKPHARQANEISMLSSLGNTGIIGIPLCTTLFGSKGALFAAVFDVGMAFSLWTLAVMILKQERSIKISNLKAMVNAPMIAIVSGLSIALSGWHVPEFIADFTGTLAKMTTPLAMIYIGMLFSSNIRSVKQIVSFKLALPVVFKLLAFPVLALLIIVAFAVPKELAQIIFIEASMPTATMAAIVFARYGADEPLALLATLISTIVSLLTIPLVVSLGKIFMLNRLF